jgi:hypothetical protein
MPIRGQLEITLRITELPKAETLQNDWRRFIVACDGGKVSVTVRPRLWAKLQHAYENYPAFVAAITGKMGPLTKTGFILAEPSIQVKQVKSSVEVA